jgi:hypothetical protein
LQRAIRVSDTLSVIPVFSAESATQLTPRGLQPVTQTICRLYDANGLEVIGIGVSLGQPEDQRDDRIGLRKSLQRALDDAQLSTEERANVWVAAVPVLTTYQPIPPAPAPVIPFQPRQVPSLHDIYFPSLDALKAAGF